MENINVLERDVFGRRPGMCFVVSNRELLGNLKEKDKEKIETVTISIQTGPYFYSTPELSLPDLWDNYTSVEVALLYGNLKYPRSTFVYPSQAHPSLKDEFDWYFIGGCLAPYMPTIKAEKLLVSLFNLYGLHTIESSGYHRTSTSPSKT